MGIIAYYLHTIVRVHLPHNSLFSGFLCHVSFLFRESGCIDLETGIVDRRGLRRRSNNKAESRNNKAGSIIISPQIVLF